MNNTANIVPADEYEANIKKVEVLDGIMQTDIHIKEVAVLANKFYEDDMTDKTVKAKKTFLIPRPNFERMYYTSLFFDNENPVESQRKKDEGAEPDSYALVIDNWRYERIHQPNVKQIALCYGLTEAKVVALEGGSKRIEIYCELVDDRIFMQERPLHDETIHLEKDVLLKRIEEKKKRQQPIQMPNLKVGNKNG